MKRNRKNILLAIIALVYWSSIAYEYHKAYNTELQNSTEFENYLESLDLEFID